MIDIFTCKKASVYYNVDRLTIEQIKNCTGCTHIINGYEFDRKFKPYGWTVVDGEILSRDTQNEFGFSCNKHGLPVMSTDRSRYFLSAHPILKSNSRVYYKLSPDLVQPTERTAVAWFPNGRVILWCDNQKLTRDELQTKLLSLGASNALMLGSGKNIQCIFPQGRVESPNLVPTLLLFWADNPANVKNHRE